MSKIATSYRYPIAKINFPIYKLEDLKHMFEIRNMLRITNGLLKNVDAVASSLPSPL
jgi:hypothetical protein